MTTKNIPDPDLLIRTSGEFRVSNFLLWQIAYSEFVILDVYWPDFSREHLYNAIRQYQKRERRFGKVSEQIISSSNELHNKD
ncbi:MAG: undecaprenyl diphosphate synthase family protein [Ignavibacteriaceae bacterium]|nr:undecaprenyl diphosphate synthase family protein [Ignavibacteriaceae bacterium]